VLYTCLLGIPIPLLTEQGTRAAEVRKKFQQKPGKPPVGKAATVMKMLPEYSESLYVSLPSLKILLRVYLYMADISPFFSLFLSLSHSHSLLPHAPLSPQPVASESRPSMRSESLSTPRPAVVFTGSDSPPLPAEKMDAETVTPPPLPTQGVFLRSTAVHRPLHVTAAQSEQVDTHLAQLGVGMFMHTSLDTCVFIGRLAVS
jgi:hypothetical protein